MENGTLSAQYNYSAIPRGPQLGQVSKVPGLSCGSEAPPIPARHVRGAAKVSNQQWILNGFKCILCSFLIDTWFSSN